MDLSFDLPATSYHIFIAKSVEFCEKAKIFYKKCNFILLYNNFLLLYKFWNFKKIDCMIRNDSTYLRKVKYPSLENFNTHIEEKFNDNKYNDDNKIYKNNITIYTKLLMSSMKLLKNS